jgi:hypothetical protein
MTIIADLFRTLREMRSLLASPTDGNVEAAKKIVDDMCEEAGIPEPPPPATANEPKASK